MRNLYISIIAAFLAVSAFADPYKQLWLAKPVSVENDAGVHGYPIGTPVFADGSQYKVGVDTVKLTPDFITENFETVRPILIQHAVALAKPVATPTPAPKPAEAPKAVSNGPRTLTVAQGGLQVAGGLETSAGGSSAHGKTSRGFYVNADGSLGNRVGH